MAPLSKRIDFDALVAQKDDNNITNSTRIRNRCDAIANILIDLLEGANAPGSISAPTGIDAQGGENRASISWSASPGAVRYRLFRRGDGDTDFVAIVSTAATLYIDSGLAAGTYSYYVRAESLSQVLSPPSESVTVVVTEAVADDPTTPTGFALSGSATYSTAVLVWDALAAGTESIRIERQRESGPYETVAALTGTTWTDTTLMERTTYRYRAYGVASDGDESAVTSVVTVTTPAEDQIPPPVPGDLVAEARPGAVFLSWEAVEDNNGGPVSYDLQVGSVIGGPFAPAGRYTQNEIQVPAAPGAGVYIRVSAVDSSLNASALTAAFGAVAGALAPGDPPPPAPSNLRALATAPGEITLTWTGIDPAAAGAENATQYRLYASKTPLGSISGPWETLGSPIGLTFTTAVRASLDPGETYFFYLVTEDSSAQQSERSNIASNVVPLTPPAGGGAGTGIKLPTLDESTGVVVRDSEGQPGSGVGDPPPMVIPATVPGGITSLPSDGSTVHQYLNETLEANAARFVEPRVAARGVRTAAEGNFFPNPAAHTNFISKAVSGLPYWSSLINSGRPAYNSLADYTPLSAYTNVPVIKDCSFRTVQENQFCSLHWTLQRYQMPGVIILDSDFGSEDFVQKTSTETGTCQPGNVGPAFWTRQLEHAHYDRTEGSWFVKGNTYARLGGRGGYVVNRPYAFQQYPPGNREWVARQLAYYDNNHLIHTDCDLGRGAYNLSFFDYGSPDFQSIVVVRNSTFVGGWPFYQNQNSERVPLNDPRPASSPNQWFRSNGGITFTQYQYCENPDTPYTNSLYFGYAPTANPGFDMSTMDHICEKMVVDNCLFHYARPSKPIIQVDGVETLIIEDCAFIVEDGSGVIQVNEGRYDANGSSDRMTKPVSEIIVRNCVTRGSILLEVQPAGGNGYSTRRRIDIHCPGRQLTINSEGVVTANVAWVSETSGYNPAADINTIEPFSGMDIQGETLDWGVAGVTYTI